MTIQQLKYIVAVDKYRNFTRAAEHCEVAQATLSAMVKKLERELNTVIFDRSASPIITTECGKEIVDEARKLIFHSENILHLPNHITDHITGRISIGIIPTIANPLLPLVIAPIVEAFPELVVEWHELTTDDIVAQLRKGELDAGILATSPGEDEIDGNILYYELLKVYGTHSSTRKFLIPEDIKEENFWLLEEGNCLRDQFINVCELKHAVAPKQFKFEPGSFETLLDMVDLYGGLTMLPELYERKLTPERQKMVYRFEAPYPVREVSIVFARPYAKHRIIEALSRKLREIVGPLLETSQIPNSELIIAKI